MLHHVSVGVRDVARAASFYDPVLKALGYKRVADYSPGAIAYGESKDKPEFWIGLPHDKDAPSNGNGAHLAFVAKSKAQVNKFHEAALKAGGGNNGEPGPRPDYGPAYYGAFIYDLDGNKIEATFIAAAKPAASKPAKKKAASRNRPHGTAIAKGKKKAKKKAKRR
ncbi:MAG TPA: VOC family protein [Rhizomicrobium sp.]|nr:VOC family protein [Rhizomicrobium sp.]